MTETIRFKLRERGAAGLCLGLLRRLPGVHALRVFRTYELPADELADEREDPGAGLEVRSAPRDLEDLSRINDKAGLFEDRLERGDRCLVCYLHGEPAGYVWCQDGLTHREARLGFEIRVRPDEMYCYDMHVRPDCRRRGVARALMRALARACRDRLGRRRLASIIELHNKRSIRANERIGWRPAHLGCFVQAFGLTWHRSRF